MGTDIHLAAEARDDEGRWVLVPGPITECWACDGTGARRSDPGRACTFCTTEVYRYDGEAPYVNERYVGEPGKIRDSWYSDRNYDVFAYLADVRNGSGFAGVRRGEPVVPISEPRGVPDDASGAALALLSNEHTPSWLMLTEIFAYDWGQAQVCSGVVSPAEFMEFERTGKPSSWCGDIQGGGVVHITNDEMRTGIANGTIPVEAGLGLAKHYTRVEWIERAGDKVARFLDRMRELQLAVGERECRIVFDFDS